MTFAQAMFIAVMASSFVGLDRETLPFLGRLGVGLVLLLVYFLIWHFGGLGK